MVVTNIRYGQMMTIDGEGGEGGSRKAQIWLTYYVNPNFKSCLIEQSGYLVMFK